MNPTPQTEPTLLGKLIAHPAADRWVILFAVILFGWNLWGYDLWAPDEPYFGEGAREMVADGNWLVPHVNGVVTTDKPPLFFWLIALVSLPFGGVSAFTARLPSTLAALGTVVLTMRLARRTDGPRVAALTGIILLTTYMFWEKARWSQIDSLLCFLVVCALSAFTAFRNGDWSGRPAGLVFWGCAGLAVLAKGPVGLLLPLGIAVVTLLFERRLRAWAQFAPLTGPLLFVGIAGMWVGATMLWGEGYSVWGALREHFVDRAVKGMHHAQPAWYYLKVLPYALFPWSFLLPGAVLLAWRRRRHPDDRFLLAWCFYVLTVFTISTEKRDLYILPALPAIALLMTRLVTAVSVQGNVAGTVRERVPHRRWVTVPQGAAGTLMLLAAVGAPLVARREHEHLFIPSLLLAAALGTGGSAILVQAVRGRVMASLQWTGLTTAIVFLIGVTVFHPVINRGKSGRELAAIVRDATAESRAAGRPVFGFEIGNVARGVNFYSPGIYVQILDHPDALLAEIGQEATTYLLADKNALPPLPDSVSTRMQLLYSARLSRRDIVFIRFEPRSSG